MSALGQKQTFAMQIGMSALPLKADMCGALAYVRLVPIADIRRKKEEAAWGQAASKRTSRLGTGTCPAKSLRHIRCVQSQSASFLVQTPLNEGALMISKVGLQKPFVSLDV